MELDARVEHSRQKCHNQPSDFFCFVRFIVIGDKKGVLSLHNCALFLYAHIVYHIRRDESPVL